MRLDTIPMLNFRKLKQNFASNVIKEGKDLFEKGAVLSVKIHHIDTKVIRISARISGNFNNVYEGLLEIDRLESEVLDSDCDCPYQYDCQHLAALSFHLEKYINRVIVDYSKEEKVLAIEDDKDRQELQKAFEHAQVKESKRQDAQLKKELLQEYVHSAAILGNSVFFSSLGQQKIDSAELLFIFSLGKEGKGRWIEFQLAFRLPFRSKPLYVPSLQDFFEKFYYREPLNISGKEYLFCEESFQTDQAKLICAMIGRVEYHRADGDKEQKVGYLDKRAFGQILANQAESYLKELQEAGQITGEHTLFTIPHIFIDSLESPLQVSLQPAQISFEIEYLESPSSKVFLKPLIHLLKKNTLSISQAHLFDAPKPGLIHQNCYYFFHDKITRQHLLSLKDLESITVPEPLIGTLVENALPALAKYGTILKKERIKQIVTLPYVETLQGKCQIEYLDRELEAKLFFCYADLEVPALSNHIDVKKAMGFVSADGILARNLAEENQMIQALFEGFTMNDKKDGFIAKTERKIVEFMTEIVPKYQASIQFDCPENLLDQFIYDKTSFDLKLRESSEIDKYEVELKVHGDLIGIPMEAVWECITANKTYIELQTPGKKKTRQKTAQNNKILVLNLDSLEPVFEVFDEIGIQDLKNHKTYRPLWSLAPINEKIFENLPIQFSISRELKEIQEQILGEKTVQLPPIPKPFKSLLRPYQVTGVQWLSKLRKMYLNGILADDMGLGKTVQAIVAVSQAIEASPGRQSIIICPTSLVYNWSEEFGKFNRQIRILVVDGPPVQRKKLLKVLHKYDVIVTSYTLLQKDIDVYKNTDFLYAILDEAQHIKNRGTLNAKSVKQLVATHKLILTGTPIENSLEELWSLFDFLMPGLLSTYDRFVDKYIKNTTVPQAERLKALRQKVTPFILRRLKQDVLKELPPVSDIVYHCHMSDIQKKLYASYAKSAREELSKLVEKEGFEKVQIHVLATLTRLKQICCHPSIFAKESIEEGDSSKYEMLLELLQSLIEGKHKTVIFSQYTRMLKIMRKDFERLGIEFCYLDGSTKDRLEVVKKFNEDKNIPVFLVSLKAGGTGLNLTGADTVIHYDMWWNPAVQNQATDRVHRMGQQSMVSSFKLVTLNSIEEKILNLQQKKKGIVTKLVNCDEDVISKLTWEEVLELLQI